MVGALAVVSAAPHAIAPHAIAVAHADPEPSAKELRTKALKLADQLEQLTEQYNGLKVRLAQSQRAAKVATENAKRQEKTLEALRQKVGSLAATSYMQGGSDPAVSFVASQDPQSILDQAATLHYFAKQDSTQVLGLMQAMQSAQRARKSAEARAKQVKALKTQLDSQRTKITDAYEKIRGKLVDKDPTQLAKLPVIGTGKAAQALRYAMGKIGRPYVWGAAGPTTFDCSGLTMWAYKQVGINLPHYTGSQWNAGTHVSRGDLQPGDLVFFYSDLHHMGIYVGGDKMLHAPHTGDVVKIASMNGRPFAGGVRVA
ncbi:C40 family peptidase [Actinomadura citrea]|jgi:cell wall-associated NlpC family hydrolase|uniref:Cell wall-associated NlpC family hydrolase n=1 Tax=Actinomadura citrea TaxID=46158 RepID=A0A7Y9KFL6_9ACTN|nr:NlpC/P60 family protein [Actinomadura citrea]NYE17512.1 cell wall-associated NlpC family hydrolase [Actinomadura citrea]